MNTNPIVCYTQYMLLYTCVWLLHKRLTSVFITSMCVLPVSRAFFFCSIFSLILETLFCTNVVLFVFFSSSNVGVFLNAITHIFHKSSMIMAFEILITFNTHTRVRHNLVTWNSKFKRSNRNVSRAISVSVSALLLLLRDSIYGCVCVCVPKDNSTIWR